MEPVGLEAADLRESRKRGESWRRERQQPRKTGWRTTRPVSSMARGRRKPGALRGLLQRPAKAAQKVQPRAAHPARKRKSLKRLPTLLDEALGVEKLRTKSPLLGLERQLPNQPKWPSRPPHPKLRRAHPSRRRALRQRGQRRRLGKRAAPRKPLLRPPQRPAPKRPVLPNAAA